jgi:rfaE bifunctional protein kinase chain/domain
MGLAVITIPRKRLEKIFNSPRGKRILVVGDVMLDEYLVGSVARISPEAPVPVIEIEEQHLSLGGAANVALNVLNLGCIPVLVGVVGKDAMGSAFNKLMRHKNLELSGIIQLKNRPTTVKTRIIGHTQHIARVDREVRDDLNAHEEDMLIRQLQENIPRCAAVIFQDYNKGVLSPRVIAAGISLARKHQLLITVDPKFHNFLNYKNVTVFKPNIKETEEALAIKIRSEADLRNACKKLMRQLNPDCLLLTRGASGMSLLDRRGTLIHVPTRVRKVADVSGAGDTVISVLTVTLNGGATYTEAATLANYAAGIVCEEVGIVPIDKQKLMKACLGQNI